MDVRRFAVRLLAGIGLLSSSLVGLAQQPPETFEVEETTIRQIHAALRSRTLTCRELVERYLARIRAYEDGGPRLNSITTVNPRALELAASLDGELERTGELRELHCVPVLLKDNINTADMPTSSGSALLKDAVPAADATLVAALREAGAIVFGKAALGELAAGSYNTIDGQQLNPYNFKRNTGGSSSGSAAAVAANLTAVAVGTDTYTSVRAPAGFTGIVGLRPTTGLISRNGIAPRKWNVDTAGPMTRTVEDAALLLNVLAGPNPADPLSVEVFEQYPPAGKAGDRYADFTEHLRAEALRGARIGIVRDFFGGDPEIDALAEAAVRQMERLGAETIDVRLDPEFLDRYVVNGIENLTTVLMYAFRENWEAYLRSSFGQTVPSTVAEWVRLYETDLAATPLPPASGRFAALTILRESLAHSADEPAYQNVIRNVLPSLTMAKLAFFERNGVDALVFPYHATFAAPISNPNETVEDPSFVAADGVPNPSNLAGYGSVGFPMIVVPMGFGSAGLPAGIAIMGRPYAEGTILAYAYAYEQAAQMRKPSPLLPPLE